MTPHRSIRSSSSVSPFVLFLQRATNANPPTTNYGLNDDSTLPRHLLDHIHNHLPLSSLLALRLVSSVTKHYIDHSHPSPLSHLHLTLPPTPPPSLPHLQDFLRHCTHLKLTITTPPPLPPAKLNNDPPFSPTKLFKLLPNLTTLHLSLPSPTPTPLHHTTLLSIRHALEDCSYDLNQLRTLRLHPITARGLLSLRSGAFSCFERADWMRGKFWQGITRLEVGMEGGLQEENGDGDDDGEEWGVREERAKRRRDGVRMGWKIVHDFLHDLAPSLRGLEFEWLDAVRAFPGPYRCYPGITPSSSSSAAPPSSSSAAPPSSASSAAPSSSASSTVPPLSASSTSSAPPPSSSASSAPPPPSSTTPPPYPPLPFPNPNPLLLDLDLPHLYPPRRALFAPHPNPITKWFTAPPILWPQLRQLRLGGVCIREDDIRKLKGRAGGLVTLGGWGGEWGGGDWGEEEEEEEGEEERTDGGNAEGWTQPHHTSPLLLTRSSRGLSERHTRKQASGRWTDLDLSRIVPASAVQVGGIGCGGAEESRNGALLAKDVRDVGRGKEEEEEETDGGESEMDEDEEEEGEVGGWDGGRGVESLVLTFVLDMSTGGRGG